FFYLLGILIFFDFGCNESSSDKFVQVSESGLSFKLPRTWKKITGPDLDAYRQQIQEQSYSQARSLGFPDPEDFKIREFAMFSAAEEEIAAVLALAIKIPSSLDTSYIEMMYENMSGQIYSRFDKVNVFRITEIDQTPVLESDVQGEGGSRIITYNFWSPTAPSQAFLLQVIIAPGHYLEFKPVIDSLRNSIHFNLQK
ncbi:MAG: hypothetical protein V2B15_06685, partial [Bacteroidota bacterium]